TGGILQLGTAARNRHDDSPDRQRTICTMPTFIIWHRGGRRRAGRSENKLLGDVEAADEQEARRIASGRWRDMPLLIYEQRLDRRFDSAGRKYANGGAAADAEPLPSARRGVPEPRARMCER